MPYARGVGPIVLGLLAGVGGFFVWIYEECTRVFVLTGACLATARPFETAGLVLMIFGGILFVVGIIFLTIPGGRGAQAGAPSAPPPAVPPTDPKGVSPQGVPEKPRPSKWTPRKTVLVLLIAAAIITGSILGGIFAFQAWNQPHVLVRNFDASLGSCGFFSPNQSVFVNSFHLVNTGPAAGYVDVAVAVDGNVVRTYTFLVLSGEDRIFDPSEDAIHSFSPSDWTISLQGCSSQVVSYVVGNVWKA